MPLGRAAGGDSKSSQRKTIVSIVLAVLVIAAVVVAGVYVVRHRTTTAAAPSSGPSTSPSELPAAEPPVCGDGDALLAAMSTRDKLAQMLMVGVTGADDARAVVAKEHVGGIMIGSWTDLTMLGDPLKEIAASAGALPLAVSTDEEGGRVSRLKSLIGVQESARVLGRTVSPQDVHDIAFARGKAMKDLGITVDFAPDADVSDQDDDTVIGDRSFSADPQKVTEYAGAYAKGLLDAGVTPVLKHFPGHGHASGDSHEGGVVTPPLSDLMTNDLVPYRELAQVPGTAVMVGHMQVPGLTGSDPASLSPAAYSLLRTGGYGGLPFGGVVFTDDISSMGAINQRYTVAQAALKALQSGADIALWITTDEVPGVLDSLEAAVANGGLDPKKVDASVLRIAALKGKSSRCGG
ncbi:glycoside hydrolase family 3 protein [Mycobacterium yunnanensis]|uniref:beta-N-acetylhexosaminidase n=1 Tax=Mycobacterium yunnanensis TaxID=368477 RepID=A0A9X2YS86_9MYCO|nr:glycoside hydrolase family 3 N-terminal domain-containing protein [Mycobacterium yunnanensis]MCV7424647.1 glycoside hydrolase family 3 protein [Mycobacterium yunnanensis]